MAWGIRINIYKLVILHNFELNCNNFITKYGFEYSAFSTVWKVSVKILNLRHTGANGRMTLQRNYELSPGIN
jgi:hypothetical protein